MSGFFYPLVSCQDSFAGRPFPWHVLVGGSGSPWRPRSARGPGLTGPTAAGGRGIVTGQEGNPDGHADLGTTLATRSTWRGCSWCGPAGAARLRHPWLLQPGKCAVIPFHRHVASTCPPHGLHMV